MKSASIGIIFLLCVIAAAILVWSRHEPGVAIPEKKASNASSIVSFRNQTIIGVLKTYESIAGERLSPSVVVVKEDRIIADFDISADSPEQTLVQLKEVLRRNGVLVHRTTYTKVLVADVLHDYKKE